MKLFVYHIFAQYSMYIYEYSMPVNKIFENSDTVNVSTQANNLSGFENIDRS